jgi:hypothetical protein
MGASKGHDTLLPVLSTYARRLLATILLTGLFLIGSVASSLHFVIVEHAVCSEHGQWVEIDDAESGRDSCMESSAEASTGLRDGPRYGTSHERDAHHAHCALAAMQREKVATGVTGAHMPRVQDAGFASCASPRTYGSSSIPLILLAPNHSPPA